MDIVSDGTFKTKLPSLELTVWLQRRGGLPEWLDAQAATEQEARASRMQLYKGVKGVCNEMMHTALTLRRRWRDDTVAETARRQRLDNSWGAMRVILRAWREVADGVRAGAARWDAVWAGDRAHDRRLGSRLHVGVATIRRGHEWSVRVVLAWMRLVRCADVHRQRRQSPVWRRAEAQWRQANTVVQPAVGTWATEVTVFDDTAGGAASVLAKRRREQEAVEARAAKVVAAERGAGYRPGKRQAAVAPVQTRQEVVRRRTDSSLVHSVAAFAHMTRFLGSWWEVRDDG